MSKKERLNKVLDYLKNLINGLSIILIGLISYTFVNFEKIDGIRLFLISLSFVGTIILIGIFVRILLKKLDELEKL